MLFNSFIFFIFLAIVWIIFYVLPSKQGKNIFLLIASYIFYGYWDWRFCGLLLLSTVVDFFVGAALHRSDSERKRKGYLLLSMAVNLGVLGFFKYFNFFVDSFQSIVAAFGAQPDYLHLNIILPVGISFYTFQTMSYTIDIYRKKLEPTHSLIDFALFVSFFPQLVAGPIERASALLPQLSQKLHPTKEQLQKGLHLIVFGLFKKVMIGDAAGRMVDQFFSAPQDYASIELLCALVLFSLQIYADFSGYSSMARGVAKLLGVELMKNFEQPYLSRNITEFWRRWHISLSSWLKDYLYISLGGNRISISRTYVNLFITMLLGGLWHGASWNFVIWGALHGLYLSIHKYALRWRKVSASYTYRGRKDAVNSLLHLLLTNVLVLFAWLFFRATDLSIVGVFFSKLWHWEASPYAGRLLLSVLSFLIMTMTMDILQYRYKKHTFLLLVNNVYLRLAVLAAMLLVSLLFMFNSDPLPFVYFQF